MIIAQINIGVHQELAFCNACESGSVELVGGFSIRTTELKIIAISFIIVYLVQYCKMS